MQYDFCLFVCVFLSTLHLLHRVVVLLPASFLLQRLVEML